MSVFMLFVISRYMQWGARKSIFAAIRIEFLFGIFLIAGCAYLLTTRPIRLAANQKAKKVVVAISLLFLAMIVQLPMAADPFMAQNMFIDRVVKFAMLTFFMVALIRSPDGFRMFMLAFLMACFYVTQESTRGAISGSLVWENQGIMRLHGAVPIYRHPNSLGGMAMGVLPFCIFLFNVTVSKIRRLFYLPLAATALVCIVYSGSRTAYVALLGLLFFWWSQQKRKFRFLLLALGISVAVIPIIPEQYIQRFESIKGQEAEGNSKGKRIEILQDAVAVFIKNPAGVGVASFPAVRQRMFGRSQDTHNLYLEVATNLGIQGFAVFIFLLSAMFSALSSARRRARRQIAGLQHSLRGGQTSRRFRRMIGQQIIDLKYMDGLLTGFMGFLWVRLVLGLFGMDLYEPYWWFAAGGAIAGCFVVDTMSRRTRQLLLAGGLT